MCARTGGHLFVTQKQSGLGDLINLLDENKLYWVGGFQYTTLIWTVDNTRYYRRLGYMSDVYGGHVTPSTIEDNSAFMCNMRCGTNHGLFGLKGQSCYCFGDRSEQLIRRSYIANDITHTEIRCPGDYTELCGENRRISVYTGVGHMTNISRNGIYGYATKYHRNTRKTTFHLDDDRNRKRFYAYKKPTEVTRDGSGLRCRGDVCVSNTTESWAAADQQNHRLLKVTDSNKEHFWSAMHYQTYWIGLRRYSEYRWINGNKLARNVSRYYSDKQCLAVRRDESHFDLGWHRCSENYNAVCQSHNRISTKPHTTKDDTGIYIGVAVSIVAVAMLCLIVAIILLKRCV
ncbi:uncharacterized protein [Haliotis cracherodii]|uniref:uncharacterized protein n=1 Tax=Haliotis cracherodii TaxID=6455 RepID=UPI0039E8A64C